MLSGNVLTQLRLIPRQNVLGRSRQSVAIRKRCYHHNWNVETSVTQNIGTLTESIFKTQLSLSTSYGGKSLDSTKEEWSEEYTESDELEFDVEPDKTKYIWQYVLGIGKKSVFFSRHRRITDSPTMPDEVPIPTTSGFLTH